MSRFLQQHALDPPVLVWTVGKVASSSIYATLRQSNIDAIHVHYLSDELVSHQINWMYAGRALPLHLAGSLRFLHAFQRHLYKPPVRIVTLVRDPLARNISAYFENLKNYGLSSSDEPARHLENFLERYHHGVVYDWFDDELLRVTGIDYRKLQFDPTKGWCAYRDAHFELLVLRAEESDARKLEALSVFFDRDFPGLVRANEGMSKSYRDAYAAFKAALVLPQTYVDRIYQHPFCRVFWTADEIAAMRAQWKTAPDISSRASPPEMQPQAGRVIDDVRSGWEEQLSGFARNAELKVSGVLRCEARLSVRLHDWDGRFVTSFEPRAGTLALLPGRFDVALGVADLPLAPGVYKATLEVASLGREGSSQIKLAPLVIGRTAKRSPRQGLIEMSFKWEQRNTDEAAQAH